MTDHPAHRRIAKANEVNAERLARLIAFADDPNRRRPEGVAEVYDGPEPDEDHMTGREMDRRAGFHYPEGP